MINHKLSLSLFALIFLFLPIATWASSPGCFWSLRDNCSDRIWWATWSNDANCTSPKPNRGTTQKCCCPIGCCKKTWVGMSATNTDVVWTFALSKDKCSGPPKQGVYPIKYEFFDGQVPSAKSNATSCISPSVIADFDDSNIAPDTPPIKGTANWSISGMTNPVRTIKPAEVIGRVVRAILLIIGSIALLMFIAGGVTWMTAAGNDAKITKAKNTLVWATLGLVVIFAAYLLVKYVMEAVGAV